MANHWHTQPIIDTHGQSLTHMANHWHTRPIIDTHSQSLTHMVNHRHTWPITNHGHTWSITDAHINNNNRRRLFMVQNVIRAQHAYRCTLFITHTHTNTHMSTHAYPWPTDRHVRHNLHSAAIPKCHSVLYINRNRASVNHKRKNRVGKALANTKSYFECDNGPDCFVPEPCAPG